MPTIELPQLGFILVATLVIWAIYRPHGPGNR
jgi:hypothetical protein